MGEVGSSERGVGVYCDLFIGKQRNGGKKEMKIVEVLKKKFFEVVQSITIRYLKKNSSGIELSEHICPKFNDKYHSSSIL